MPGIHVEGLSQATPEVNATCLQRGDYNVVIQAVNPVTAQSGNINLQFELLVEDGPMQVVKKRDGTTFEVSPAGRHMFSWVSLPSPSHKDGGKFATSRLRTICDVCDVRIDDSDNIEELNEFIGKPVRVRNAPQVGNDGIERDDIKAWMEAL